MDDGVVPDAVGDAAPEAVADGPGHDPYAALRHGNYALYILARNLATVGARMTGVAVGWELYGRTHNPLALGWVGLVQFLPVLLLALPAGHLADRRNRKSIVQTTQALLSVCSLGLAAISLTHAPVPYFYLCLLAGAIARAVSGPARSAMLPQLIPPEDYPSAVKWSSTAFQVAMTLGPALGGLVIALRGGPALAYVLDATAGAVAIVMVSFVRTPFAQKSPSGPVTLRTLAAGVHFVWQTRIILATITLDLFAVLLGGAVTLLPVYARDILGVGPRGLGWLEAAPSAGALCMAIAVAHLPPFRKAGAAMLWAIAGFGLATMVFGISRAFPLSFAMLFLTGALDLVSVVVRSTLVQVLTPPEMLGRVSAVNSVFISSSNQLGGFESGLVARLFGPVFAVVSGGIGTMLVVASVASAWPEVRRFGRLEGTRE